MTRLTLCVVVGCWMLFGACPSNAVQEASVSENGTDVSALKERAYPLDSSDDLDPLLQRIGDARLVLLGEASHGTSEFYTWRAAISRRLIKEKGFQFIAVEGDWAPLFRLNRYIKGLDPTSTSARQIMATFDRWPQWMWANEETADLIEWLYEYNKERALEDRVGFYGIDVYGEDRSIQMVRDRLSDVDPGLAEQIDAALACMEAYGGDMQAYARAVAFAGATPCAPALEQAYALLKNAMAGYEGLARYTMFDMKLNAKVVMNAEAHFRLMAAPGPASWNARVDHFFAVVDRLQDWHGTGSRGIVWAHNTHVGDARATSMVQRGQRNIGQIARERYAPGEVVAVGFGTDRGTVQAGRSWGAPMETMSVPSAGPETVEWLMRHTGHAAALYIFDDGEEWAPLLRGLGHRAIGVVYHPEQEYPGNYVPTVLPRRYDAFIFIEETRALRSLK